jgi:hypothetical protein
MGQELSGPLAIEARADFMTDDLWTVHRGYHVELEYPGDVRVVVDDAFEVGLAFKGDEGSIFCTREGAEALRPSAPELLAPLPDGATRFAPGRDHYENWLESVRGGRDPVAPIDQAARSLTACYLSWLTMRLGRRLRWDPAREHFLDDPEADARLPQPARAVRHPRAARAGLA